MAENQDINIKINIDTGAANATVKAVKESLGDISKVSKEINKQREEEVKTINNVATANANALKGVEKKLDTELRGLKGMRIEYKELLKQLDAAAAAGDTISFKRIESELGALRNDISDTAKRMKMLDPGEILGGWVKFGQGVVGAYSAITAAADLFGSENEQLQEIERKSMQLIQLMIGLEQARQILIDSGGRAQLKALVETTALQWKQVASMIASNLTIKTISTSSKTAAAAQMAWNAAIASNPMGLLIAGVAALTVGVVLLVRHMTAQSAVQKDINKANKEAAKDIGEQKQDLNELLKVARDHSKSLKERQDAIDSINKLSPQYLGNLNLETIGTKAAATAINLYTQEISTRAKAKALESILTEKYIKLEEQYASGAQIEHISKTKDEILDLEDKLADLTATTAIFTQVNGNGQQSMIDLIGTSQIGVPEGTKALNYDGTPIEYKGGKWVAVIVPPPSGNSSGPSEGDKAKIGGIWMTYTNGKWKADYEIEAIDVEIRVAESPEVESDIVDIRGELEKKVNDELDRIEEERAIEQGLRDNARSMFELDSFEYTLEQKQALLEFYTEKGYITKEEYAKNSEQLQLEQTQKEIDGAKQVFDGISGILQTSMDAELAGAEGNAKKQKEIKKKYALGQAALSLSQIGINTAEGVTKAIAQTGILAEFAIPLILGQGIASAALVMNQTKNIMKMAKGGILRGPSHANGGIVAGNVEFEGNEGVVNKNTMANPSLANMVSIANMAGGGVPLTNNTTSIIDYKLLASEMAAVINDKKVYVVESDITKTQSRVKVIENKNKF